MTLDTLGQSAEKIQETASSNELRYRAFISYSHVDKRWAEWLHLKLETFTVDKDLAGATTPTGAIPKNLRPVFRDRDEFTAGKALGEQTRDAISHSAALIVVCSPAAAKSEYVNNEIRMFKLERADRPVIPLIVEGKPGDPSFDCFPPALRFKIKSDGSIAEEAEIPLGGDVREDGDGRDLAFAKVVAGLLGLGADDVYRRAERTRRRSARRRNLVVLALTLLLIGIAGSATYAIYQDSVSRREQGLKLVSDAYELLYRDPSLAFLKAFRASTLLPEPEARPALNDAYKVAVLHHYNRREIAQLTGSGPTYLAGRWKQGQIFSEASPDGRYRLIVTERGRDGWPTGEVYLLNNESLRVIKLGSCIQNGNGRVEDVGFDSGSKNVFVSRNFNVSAYSLTGQCVGRFELSCCTKSPVHLVEGYLDDRFLIVAETKGGLWLVDKGQTGVLRPIVLQPEFHGDPAVSATLSPDGQNAAVVFESGRVAIIDAQQCIVERVKKEHCFRDLSKENALFANFYPGEKDRVVTAGRDGVIRHWQISQNEVKETERQSLPGVAIDWVASQMSRVQAKSRSLAEM